MNVIFHASAGTGKTFQVTHLYAALVLGRPFETKTPDGKTAILHEAADGPLDPRVIDRAAGAGRAARCHGSLVVVVSDAPGRRGGRRRIGVAGHGGGPRGMVVMRQLALKSGGNGRRGRDGGRAAMASSKSLARRSTSLSASSWTFVSSPRSIV